MRREDLVYRYVLELDDKASAPWNRASRVQVAAIAAVEDGLDRQTRAAIKHASVTTNLTGRQTAAYTQVAAAARRNDAEVTRAALNSSATVSGAAVREVAALRKRGFTYRQIAIDHRRAGVSAEQSAAMIERAAARERRAYESVAAAAARSRSARAAAGGAVSNTLRRGVTTAGVAATLGAGVTVRETVAFDRQLRNVNSLAHLSERALDRVGDRIELIGSRTAQLPVTIAAGMYDLVSSGFRAGQALRIVEESAEAATAGLTDTATSTAAVAAVLNAYHLRAGAAERVSDTLFQTVNLGVLSFEALAQNLGDVLPFASSLHVALYEVGAATATLTKAGISAPETMTRIKAVMTALLKPSEALAAAIRKTGFETGEALVKQKGFQGTLDALVGVTDGSKAAIARLFPDVRALGGALALTGANSRAANADLKAFGDVDGVKSRALAEQAKSVSYEWDRMRATASALSIDVGQDLVPAMTDLLEVGTRFSKDFFRGLKDAPPALPRALAPQANPLHVASPFPQRGAGPAMPSFTAAAITEDEVSNAEQLGQALREIVENATPVVEALADGSHELAVFVAERPALAKVAGTLLGVAGAVKAIRFVGALTGMNKLISLAGTLARTKAGQRAADAVVDGLAAIPRRGGRAIATVNAWLATKLTTAGVIGGERAAVSAASSLATQFPTSVDRRKGKLAGPFGRVGKLAGVAFAGAFLLAIPRLVDEISRQLTDALPFLERYSGSKGWGNLGSDLIRPFKALTKVPKGPFGAAGGIFSGTAFMPAFVSSGELIAYGNREWIVPGPRVAADNVFTMLPLGAKVFTEHGQALRAAGVPEDLALAAQAPHFASGGVVRGKVSTFGPPGETAAAMASGRLSSGAAIALNLQPGTDAGWRNATTQAWIAHARAGRPVRFLVQIGSHRATLPLLDLGPAASTGRAIDITGTGARRMGIDPARFPTDATGTATMVGGGRGASFMRQPSILRPRGVDILQPFGALDAFQRGFDAGVNGTGRLFRTPTGMDSDLFRAATSGVRSNARGVQLASFAGGRGGPGMWRAGTNTLAWGRAFASRFGLSISSTFRTPGQNAAAGGVSGSMHTHGSTSNPGAIDFVPPSRAALAYARGHGAREALIHDAGSGLHLHVGFFARGGIARYRTGTNAGARPRPGLGAGVLRTIARAGSGDGAVVVAQLRALGRLLDETEQITYRRLARLDGTVRGEIRDLARGGLTGLERVQVRRLRAVLTLVEATMGTRLGALVASAQNVLDVVAGNQALVGQLTDAATSRGVSTQIASDRNSLQALRGERGDLVAALRRARRAHEPAAAKAIEEQIESVSETMRELAIGIAQRAREVARLRVQEAVDASQFGVDRATATVQLLEASQRVAGTVETAGGMRARATALAGQQPALQALIDALDAQASVALRANDLDGWRQATLAAMQATTDLADAQAEAAELVRSAALRIPQEALEWADFSVQLAHAGYQGLELEQRLNGTYDTGAGGQARADFITTQVIPQIRAQIEAANALVGAAREQYGSESQQYRDALLQLAALTNQLMQAMIDARDATAANTDQLKQLGGQLAFTYRGQIFTDDINAGVGA